MLHPKFVNCSGYFKFAQYWKSRACLSEVMQGVTAILEEHIATIFFTFLNWRWNMQPPPLSPSFPKDEGRLFLLVTICRDLQCCNPGDNSLDVIVLLWWNTNKINCHLHMTLHSFRYRIIWWSGWWYRFSAIPHLWTSFLQGWSTSSSVS